MKANNFLHLRRIRVTLGRENAALASAFAKATADKQW